MFSTGLVARVKVDTTSYGFLFFFQIMQSSEIGKLFLKLPIDVKLFFVQVCLCQNSACVNLVQELNEDEAWHEKALKGHFHQSRYPVPSEMRTEEVGQVLCSSLGIHYHAKKSLDVVKFCPCIVSDIGMILAFVNREVPSTGV